MTSLRDRRRGGYEPLRLEILARIPVDARRVLDVGCSSGVLGAAVKRRQDSEVVGIELDPGYAASAEEVLDRTLCGDASAVVRRDDLGLFDCVVCADVLEHLVDPWETLSDVARACVPGATVVLSLPNVRFWQTFWYLARGQWPVRDVGLYDRTHLRWFTRRSMIALAEQAGLEVLGVDGIFKVNYNANKLDRVAGPIIARLPMRDLFAYQYVITARRAH